MKQNNLTIDEFLTALKKQVRDCAFGHACANLRANDRTRRRLFETQKLTLDKAAHLCWLTEDTKTEMRKMKINEEVSAVRVQNEGKDSNTCQNASQKVTRADPQPRRTRTGVTNVDVKICRDNAPLLERSVTFAKRQIILTNAADQAKRQNVTCAHGGRCRK